MAVVRYVVALKREVVGIESLSRAKEGSGCCAKARDGLAIAVEGGVVAYLERLDSGAIVDIYVLAEAELAVCCAIECRCFGRCC